MSLPGVGVESARSNGAVKWPRATLKWTGSTTPVMLLTPFGPPGVGVPLLAHPLWNSRDH